MFLGGEYTLNVTQMTPRIDHCWFTFDSISQTLTLLPDEKVLKQRSANGFKFKIEATSRCGGQTLSMFFHIHINERKETSCLTIEVEMEMKVPADRCLLAPILDINKRIEQYLEIETPISLVYDFGKLGSKSGHLKFTIGFVDAFTHCKRSCDKEYLQGLAFKFISEFGLINKGFIVAVGNEYNVYSVYTNTICPPQVIVEPYER